MVDSVTQWWSWILCGIGVTGLYVAARTPRIGWRINIGAQVLWATYGLATRQWGFVVSAVAYGAVFIRMLIFQEKRESGRDPQVHAG